MKLARNLTKYAEDLGLNKVQPNECKFNRKNVGVLFIFGQNFTTVTMYILFHAKTVLEHEEAFFVWITLLATSIGFFATIQRSSILYRLLDMLEIMIEDRKLFIRCMDLLWLN